MILITEVVSWSKAVDRARNFGFLIKDLSRLYTKLFEERAGALELTLPQCKALVYLAKNEGVSQIRLAELADIDPMTLVRILDRMEADGWIERRAHPTDRRARQLYVKAKSKSVLDQIWKIGEQIRGQVFAGFSAEQRDVFLELLERAHANLLELKPATPAEKPAKERVASKSTLSTRKVVRAK
ncbi:MAG: MarR family transcriptional regulator [Steroidobacteraceae bacterium]